MSMCVLLVVVILSFCTTVCLLSEKRSLQHALDDVREDLDKVRAALERQEKESHHNTPDKWLNSNHTETVKVPTRAKDWVGCSSQSFDESRQLLNQDLLSSAHSFPSTLQDHLRPSSMDDCSFYPSGDMEELPPVTSPTTTAADGSLTSWPQQRWREEGKVGLNVVWVKVQQRLSWFTLTQPFHAMNSHRTFGFCLTTSLCSSGCLYVYT